MAKKRTVTLTDEIELSSENDVVQSEIDMKESVSSSMPVTRTHEMTVKPKEVVMSKSSTDSAKTVNISDLPMVVKSGRGKPRTQLSIDLGNLEVGKARFVSEDEMPKALSNMITGLNKNFSDKKLKIVKTVEGIYVQAMPI
jgi:hypothetical protein